MCVGEGQLLGAWLPSLGITLKETESSYPHLHNRYQLPKLLRPEQDFVGPGSSMLEFSAGLILGLCECALMLGIELKASHMLAQCSVTA